MKSNMMIDKKTVEQSQKIVEQFIRKNYEGVETIKFTGVSKSPMGGLMVDGIVNGKGSFSASLDESNGGYEIGGIGKKKGFPPVKEACREKVCE